MPAVETAVDSLVSGIRVKISICTFLTSRNNLHDNMNSQENTKVTDLL